MAMLYEPSKKGPETQRVVSFRPVGQRSGELKVTSGYPVKVGETYVLDDFKQSKLIKIMRIDRRLPEDEFDHVRSECLYEIVE